MTRVPCWPQRSIDRVQTVLNHPIVEVLRYSITWPFYLGQWTRFRFNNGVCKKNHGQYKPHEALDLQKSPHVQRSSLRGKSSQNPHRMFFVAMLLWKLASGKLTVGPWFYSLVLMEIHLPTPTTARVYVNLPEGIMHKSNINIPPKDDLGGLGVPIL